MGNASILLVDNRKAIIESFRKSFSEIEVKHTLFSAANENEAWSMLDGSQKLSPIPKIILIDVNRTKNEGIQFLNSIRNHTDLKSILVFVITDSENEINKAAALNLNIAGYIPMSFESQTLNSFVSVLNEYWNIIEFSSQK
ncbi:response regulator [Flavobacterium xanthum]|uniref:Response regulator receiver domain-containing protein n=1 Tax=Flavobacterium xanthum TaxID=69322 RepID=A0A1M7I900_9FLAO|nr:response regulator [Flavobacterium xanthum]SHM37251.1 Response regulator receiver domain-containing protein [Flavobacterium xanthum]